MLESFQIFEFALGCLVSFAIGFVKDFHTADFASFSKEKLVVSLTEPLIFENAKIELLNQCWLDTLAQLHDFRPSAQKI